MWSPAGRRYKCALVLADRDVEIVADRGVHAKADADDWKSFCQTIKAEFHHSNYEASVVKRIGDVTELLNMHFPTSVRSLEGYRCSSCTQCAARARRLEELSLEKEVRCPPAF